MKADAWEGGHRMPFLVRWPGHVPEGSSSSQLLCFTDVLATLAEIIGVPLNESAGPDSISFLDTLLEGNQDSSRRSLAMQTGSGMWVVRKDQWKLISGLGSGGFSKPSRVKALADGPQGQLYDLSNDPAETSNLYLEKPQKVAELKAELERLRSAQRTR